MLGQTKGLYATQLDFLLQDYRDTENNGFVNPKMYKRLATWMSCSLASVFC